MPCVLSSTHVLATWSSLCQVKSQKGVVSGRNWRTKNPTKAAKTADTAIATKADGIPGPIIQENSFSNLVL